MRFLGHSGGDRDGDDKLQNIQTVISFSICVYLINVLSFFIMRVLFKKKSWLKKIFPKHKKKEKMFSLLTLSQTCTQLNVWSALYYGCFATTKRSQCGLVSLFTPPVFPLHAGVFLSHILACWSTHPQMTLYIKKRVPCGASEQRTVTSKPRSYSAVSSLGSHDIQTSEMN